MKFDLQELKSKAQYIDPRYYGRFLVDSEERDFYKEYLSDHLILRDHLAIDRTMLANESTFLAYLRTGLAMCAAGATLIHFSEGVHANTIGGIFIGFGFLVFLIGTVRHGQMRKKIKNIRSLQNEKISRTQINDDMDGVA